MIGIEHAIGLEGKGQAADESGDVRLGQTAHKREHPQTAQGNVNQMNKIVGRDAADQRFQNQPKGNIDPGKVVI